MNKYNHSNIRALMLSLSVLILCMSFYSCSRGQSQLKENPSSNYPLSNYLQFTVMITAIFEDSKGHFWFGSHGEGLCHYNGEQFRYYTTANGLPTGMNREFAPGLDEWNRRNINGGNQIGQIAEGPDGHIYFVNGENRLIRYNGQSFEPVMTDKVKTLPLDLEGQDWEDYLDALWFGTWSDLGALRYDGESLELLTFPQPYPDRNDGVSELYIDREGRIWLGTMSNGTFLYDGQSFRCVNDPEKKGICRAVFQDESDRIWVTNNRYGLTYFEDDSLVEFSEDFIQSIEQDTAGVLWFGTFGQGLIRYEQDSYERITDDNGFPVKLVKTIYKDRKGKLWYGIGEGSVYGFDGRSFYRFDGNDIKEDPALRALDLGIPRQ